MLISLLSEKGKKLKQDSQPLPSCSTGWPRAEKELSYSHPKVEAEAAWAGGNAGRRSRIPLSQVIWKEEHQPIWKVMLRAVPLCSLKQNRQ